MLVRGTSTSDSPAAPKPNDREMAQPGHGEYDDLRHVLRADCGHLVGVPGARIFRRGSRTGLNSALRTPTSGRQLGRVRAADQAGRTGQRQAEVRHHRADA